MVCEARWASGRAVLHERIVPMPACLSACIPGSASLIACLPACLPACRWLRALASDPAVWRCQYESLWGRPPEPGLGAAVVRRMCRRSQLRAARWVEARVQVRAGRGGAWQGAGSTCAALRRCQVVLLCP